MMVAMRRVEKPWGYELIWAEAKGYVGKILHKEETFLVQAGEMDLEIGAAPDIKTLRMRAMDSYHCVPKTVHRMIAVTDVDVVEVSTPDLDDVVRLEDAYGREGTSAP
jgi:hypothetical protein